jgi:hypothetical protein
MLFGSITIHYHFSMVFLWWVSLRAPDFPGFSFVVAPQHSRSLRGPSRVTREAEEGGKIPGDDSKLGE